MGERIREKTILLTTSNGTRAVLAAREAVALGVVGFVNLSAASRWALDAGRDVTIVCAGELGGFSLEDAVCGGMVVERLQRSGAGLVLGDGAKAVGLLFRHYDGRVSEVLADCEWGRELARVGFGADLDLCGRVDCLSVVPVLSGGRLVPAPP